MNTIGFPIQLDCLFQNFQIGNQQQHKLKIDRTATAHLGVSRRASREVSLFE